MASSGKIGTVVMADDDHEDCQLVNDALQETGFAHRLLVVRDGEELWDYLRRRGGYAEGRAAPRPDLILLDLNMPRKDGREVLVELKADPRFRTIPVVVLTTSTAEDDIIFCYDMGANSYVTKPATFRQLVAVMKALTSYWFDLAELPPAN